MRKRKGKTRNLWMYKVTSRMRTKGINSMKWIDREEWRIKIETLGAERCENIDTYLNNIY